MINNKKMQCAQHTSDHRNTNTELLIFNPTNQDLRGSLGRTRYASPALTGLKTTLAFKRGGLATVCGSACGAPHSDSIASAFQRFLWNRQPNRIRQSESCPSF